MVGPAIEVDPPTRAPREGGLFTVAERRPNSRLGMAGSLVFQSDGCTFPTEEASRCIATATPPDKTFAGIEIEDAIGTPFTLYAGVACYAGPDPDFDDRARAILAQGESRMLEEALETWAAGATALAAGGSVTGAIALVEQQLDSSYLGRGVILISRADAVRGDAEGALHMVGNQIQTINGTPVIASGMAAPGTVYGLGVVTVESAEVVVTDVIGHTVNQHYAVAESSYVILVDCAFRTKSATTA